MTLAQRLASLVLSVILLLALGAGVGSWLAAQHYRPLLDTVNADLTNAKSARNNLETLATEQGRKLGELVQVGKDREQAAMLAQDKAEREARPDFSAANQLLRDRTGGDPARAAAAIIDQELGL